MVCEKTGGLVCVHKKARRQKRSPRRVLLDAVYENTFGLYAATNGLMTTNGIMATNSIMSAHSCIRFHMYSFQ